MYLTWCLDSTTSAHMTNDSGILLDPKPHDNHTKVTVGNGKILKINTVGTSYVITPNGFLRLSSVYHVPSLTCNLMPFNQFYKDIKCVVYFYGDSYMVKDSRTGKVLIQSKSLNVLYQVTGPIDPPYILSLVASVTSLECCHSRFGHPLAHAFALICKSIKIYIYLTFE